jgi:hypothetical protein
MLDAPIFIIKLLAALYLLPEPDSDPGPEPTSDFFVQKVFRASTLQERRRETRRAANEDGKREKDRIVQIRER